MSFVDRVLARSQERSWPVGSGALVGWDSPYGHDQSEFSPEEYGDYLATSNDVYSVIALRARMLSRLRMRFFRGYDADKIELPSSPAAQLYKSVNRFWTSRRLARMDELSMGVWGETFWAVEKERGVPKEIWWLKPSRVQPVTHATDYIQKFAYLSVSGQVITFEPDEIVWQRYPNPLDEFSPLSPLAAARLAADTAQSMTRANNSLHSNGLQIAGLIVPPQDKVTFSQQQADDLELQLKKRLTGSKNAGKWAVLRYEAQFKQLAITPKDAESVAGMNMSFRQVCRAYGMPSPLLNDMEHATLANLRELQKLAWEAALIPDADSRAEEVEEQFLPMFRKGVNPDHCEHDYSQIECLQESATESWAREAQALDRAAITINEWRQSKGRPPVPWGDRPLIAVNKGPLGPDNIPLTANTGNGETLPDDEADPANAPESPRFLDHMAARKLLASFRTPVNGWSH